MAFDKQLEQAADRLKIASARIEAARSRPSTPDQVHEWLEALTDYVLAMTDLHDVNVEILHENLDHVIQRQRRAITTET
jgi:hypothetical protein